MVAVVPAVRPGPQSEDGFRLAREAVGLFGRLLRAGASVAGPTRRCRCVVAWPPVPHRERLPSALHRSGYRRRPHVWV